ncbi:hypothetical protein TWF970_009136 [Orbilia oligospora]|uniref:Uncharacterized protein n=1 Tax=Orbilia oligospora TaxID=2813651 RepID=A0A7C8R3D2_ORBOL|nr:hypothetical protein TWF970_009136 [Orbilia oligospora]
MVPPHLVKEAHWSLEYLMARQVARQLERAKCCSGSCFYCFHPDIVRQNGPGQFELASFEEEFGLGIDDLQPAESQGSVTETAGGQYSYPHSQNAKCIPQERGVLGHRLDEETVRSSEEDCPGWEYLEIENFQWGEGGSSTCPAVGSDTETETDDGSVFIGAVKWNRRKPKLLAQRAMQRGGVYIRRHAIGPGGIHSLNAHISRKFNQTRGHEGSITGVDVIVPCYSSQN